MKILQNNEFHEYTGNLFINGNKISFVTGNKVEFSSKGKFIVPGFIDQHIHGSNGYDVMDNTMEAVNEVAKSIVSEGTTTFLPTTMAYDLQVTKSVLNNIYSSIGKTDGAKIAGAHLEGPFISPKYVGAQNPIYQLDPNVEILKMIDPNDVIKLITYAPENDNNMEFLKYLKSKNIVPSVGHSNATCSCVNEAIKNGLLSFTHFHNAMSPHSHREPGVVTAGFSNVDTNVELICDKIHVHPDVINTMYKVKTCDNITLVTDSMSAKNMVDGEYNLGGQAVFKKGNEARLESGSLAGSVLRLSDGLKNFVEVTECDLAEAIKMVTVNQCRLLNLENIGELKENYYFDVVVLDENLEVVQTFVDGKLLFEK